MSTQEVNYDIGIQSDGAHLRTTILRLLDEDPTWTVDAAIKVTRLAPHVGLSRGTVMRVFSQLASEGIVESLHGKGFRIRSGRPLPRATSVVSVSDFCRNSDLQCISVLDPQGCVTVRFAEVAEQIPETWRAELGANGLTSILVVRRARAFQPKDRPDVLPKWAILETLFLLEQKVPYLKEAIEDELPRAGTPDRRNFSLHGWMTRNGIELERSEYDLTLGKLDDAEAKLWDSVGAESSAHEPFLRLEAVTYGKRLGALLFTREHLVPAMFKLRVSGFKFQKGDACETWVPSRRGRVR